MDKTALIKMLKRLLWIGLAFLAAVLVISAIEQKSQTTSSLINIDIKELPGGNRLISEEDVHVAIERSFGYRLEGVPLGRLNVERIERVLNNEPFVLESEVFIDARNNLNIELVQRDPMLRIIDKNGQNYYLDKNGVKMPLSTHFSARVLVATGNLPPHIADFMEMKSHLLQDAFHLSKLILEDEFLTALVEQIYVNGVGEFNLIPKLGPQKIMLGKYEDMPDKLERLKHYYEEVVPFEGWKKHKTINLKYKKQIVCQKK